MSRPAYTESLLRVRIDEFNDIQARRRLAFEAKPHVEQEARVAEQQAEETGTVGDAARHYIERLPGLENNLLPRRQPLDGDDAPLRGDSRCYLAGLQLVESRQRAVAACQHDLALSYVAHRAYRLAGDEGEGTTALDGVLQTFTEEREKIGRQVWAPVMAAILAALVPFLSPKRLIKSGISPQKAWEFWVFRIATAALLVGVPLLLVRGLASENISGFHTHRDPDLI